MFVCFLFINTQDSKVINTKYIAPRCDSESNSTSIFQFVSEIRPGMLLTMFYQFEPAKHFAKSKTANMIISFIY